MIFRLKTRPKLKEKKILDSCFRDAYTQMVKLYPEVPLIPYYMVHVGYKLDAILLTINGLSSQGYFIKLSDIQLDNDGVITDIGRRQWGILDRYVIRIHILAERLFKERLPNPETYKIIAHVTE